MPDETPVTAKSLREKARQIRETAERRIAEIREAAEREAQRYDSAAAVLESLQSGLSSGNEYATIGEMPSTQIVASVKKRPGPPAAEGPVTNVIAELGLDSFKALADALGENEANVRSWNHRASIPSKHQAKIDKLRAKRAAKTKRED